VRAYTRQYSYDRLGNIQQLKQLGTNGFTRNFVYNAGVNTLQKIETAAPTLIENFTYDSCGNQLTAGATRNYVWNAANQLITYYNQAGSSDPTIFAQYDYAGQNRVSKMVRTGTAGSPIYERTIYIDGVFEYHILENGTTYEKNYVHVMDDTSRIAMVRIGDQFPDDITDAITYNLEDQIGSSSMRLNTTGGVIDKEEYYPFGDSSLRTFSKKRYRYVGKEKDLESGLYYYGARYYAAWTCRFISIDPLAADYVHLTPYNYAGNKPVNSIDIDGMQGTNEQTSGGSQNNTQTTENGNNNNNSQLINNVNSQTPTTKFPISCLTGKEDRSLQPIYVPPNSFDNLEVKIIRSENIYGYNDTYSSAMSLGFTLGNDFTGIGFLDDFLIPLIAVALVFNAAKESLIPAYTINYYEIVSDYSASAISIEYPLNIPIDYVSDDGITTTYNPSGFITLFRGVHPNHPDYPNALKGIATPIGGHSNPWDHNMGNNASVFTSWTVNPWLANYFPTNQGRTSGGIVLVKSVHISEITPSPDLFRQGEVLLRGIVTGAIPLPAVKF